MNIWHRELKMSFKGKGSAGQYSVEYALFDRMELLQVSSLSYSS